MDFIQIAKKRNIDMWLALQGREHHDPDAAETFEDVIYQGPASVKIARLIRKCFSTCLETPPRPWAGPCENPICRAFGYKTGRGYLYHTLILTISWDEEVDAPIRGMLFGGNYGHALATVDLAETWEDMYDIKWAGRAWTEIKRMFKYGGKM